MATGQHTHSPLSPVAEVLNWQHRVHSELNCNRNWKREWGFLAQGTEADSLDLYRSRSGTSTPPAATYIAAHKRREEAAAGTTCSTPLDKTVPIQTTRDSAIRKAPKEEFAAPLTTSQQYGWGKNLETFGRMTLTLK